MYGGGQYPPGQGWGPRRPMPPQQHHQQQHYRGPGGYPPRHAGLGSHGAAPNLPPPPNFIPPPGFAMNGLPPHGMSNDNGNPPGWNGERFSLFVGGIGDLIDGWVEKLLEAAGPVLSLKRPSPTFAFVEYGEPESVLRCLEVVNGVSVPGKSGGDKIVTVKADEKTRARLDEFEKERVKDENANDLLQQARDDLASIVSGMRAGDLPTSIRTKNEATDGMSERERERRKNLNDLQAEELPEDHRETITSEIALFRERQAKQAAEKKAREAAIEAGTFRAGISRRRANSPPPSRRVESPAAPPTSATTSTAVDPQSYNKPVAFVVEGEDSSGDLTDAQRERERAERAHKEIEAAFKQREQRFEGRERQRIAAYEREKARERAIAEKEDAEFVYLREKLANFDDDVEIDKGRESFYADRSRWRSQRRQLRQREIDSDARDRKLEREKLASVAVQSENFLDSISGGVTDSKKLSFGAVVAPKVTIPSTAKPKTSTVLGLGEDEEEGKQKRALIPLVYDDDVEMKTSNQDDEKKKVEIESNLPTNQNELFSYSLDWNLIPGFIDSSIGPFVTKTIVEYLGTEEDELLSAVTNHVRAHKTPQELVEELEPVLDEEASEFVVKIWRHLVRLNEFSRAGISA